MNDNVGLFQFDFVFSIIINYYDVKKVDLFIGLTQIIGGITEIGIPFGIETNITSIPNFISKESQQLGYFKKTTGRPLILFYDNYYETEDIFNITISKEIIINNAHYKYNFRIQPCEINQNISIRGRGNDINLIFPEKLDFSPDEESLIIRYIRSSNYYSNNIKLKLNPNSTDLQCNDLNGMIKCNVSYFHFMGEKSGFYNTYHLNHEKEYIINYNIPPINVIIPENRVYLFVEEKDNYGGINIGDNGLIYLVTNFTDKDNIFDESDIEKTLFNIEGNAYYSYYYYYNFIITCRLWKPLNEKMRIFCKSNETSIISQISYVNLKDSTFYYKGKRIRINFQTSNFNLKKANNKIPFLYSNKQIINIEKEKESYDLTFKIWEYNNETLFLQINEPDFGYKYITLDNCKIENKDLKCKVPKEKFEEVLYKDNHIISLYFYDYNLLQTKIGSVLDIIVNNNQNQKENIYIDLTKIKEEQIYANNSITYETNVTEIPELYSDIFNLSFKYESRTHIYLQKCFFKKIPDQPLLLFCLMTREGTFSLFQNETKEILNNINIKYNFIILPMEIETIFNVSNNGNYLFYEYPYVLDFHKREELVIDYHYIGYNIISGGIKLNPDSTALKCDEKSINNRYIKRCEISINHFNGKNSSYYNTYYLNYLNNYSLVYTLPPINVILPGENEIILRIKKENNKNLIKIGPKGTITFKTKYNDTKNAFKDINIDNYITFNNKIIDSDKKEYDVNCKIWKPKDENITIFCNLNENLPKSRNSIILDDKILNYNGYTIYIYQEDSIEIAQYETNIPFLYYDTQIINIDNKDSYELKFKVESYNNDILYIKGESDKENQIIMLF